MNRDHLTVRRSHRGHGPAFGGNNHTEPRDRAQPRAHDHTPGSHPSGRAVRGGER